MEEVSVGGGAPVEGVSVGGGAPVEEVSVGGGASVDVVGVVASEVLLSEKHYCRGKNGLPIKWSPELLF